MLIACEGGPWISRLLTFPPPVEIEVGTEAMYVLDERDTPDGAYLVYVYVPHRM